MSPAGQGHRFLSDELGPRELSLVLGGLMLSLFLASLNQSIVNTAIPRIVAELNGFETYAWIITAYMLTSTSVIPIIGKLGDLYGRKLFLVGGAAYFVVTTALCGLAQNMTQLIVLRGFQGLGSGVLMATAFAALAYVLPPVKRARMQGLFTGVFTLSAVIGPLLGGYLTDNLSWRFVFYANVPLGLAALFVLWRFFPEHHRRGERRPMDLLGAGVLVVATVLLLLALSWGGHGFAWDSPQIVGLFASAALALAVFIWVERHAVDPILPLGMFRNNVIAISTFGATVQSMGVFGTAVFIPLFVQGVIGTSATVSGSVVAPMTITMLLASIFNGQLIARTGSYKPFALLGFLVGTSGLFVLSLMGTDASYALILVDMMLLGFGLGFVGPTMTLASQSVARPTELGVVTSLLQFARSMGNTVGTAIFGSILTLRFVPEMEAVLPNDLAAVLPDDVRALTQTPQALLDPAAAASVRTALSELLPLMPDASEMLFAALRGGLAGSLHWVFLAGACVFGSGLVVSLFLREVPILGHDDEANAPSGSPYPDPARGGRTDSPPALTA